MIDAKLKTLTEQSLYMYSSEKFVEELTSAYSKAIIQGIKFLKNLEVGLKKNLIKEEYISFAKEVLAVRQVVLLGINPDLPSLFIVKEIREMLIKNVQKEVSDDLWNWFNQKYPCAWDWHILELNELQTFYTVEAKEHLGRHIRGYIKNVGINNQFISSDGSFPVNFRSYIINRFGTYNKARGSKKLENYIVDLKQVHDNFVSSIKDSFAI